MVCDWTTQSRLWHLFIAPKVPHLKADSRRIPPCFPASCGRNRVFLMELTILGCRSGMPADGQASSGYLVTAGADTTLLLDCGPGVATALSGLCAFDALDAVLITHVHLDHCYDLLPIGKALLSAGLRYPVDGEPPQDDVRLARRIPLYVPAGARALLTQLAALFPVATVPALDRAFDLAFDVHEYDPGQPFAVGAAQVEPELLAHAAPNCGFRITSADGTLVYTGDTGRTDALRRLARDADLLLAECTLAAPDSGPHGHLCAEDAAEVAHRAGAGQLVLTHFSSADPGQLELFRDSAAALFAGPVHVATPYARFPIHQAREALQ
ncbi:MBL fold metallo-hydrolase [Saccharopolyspora sp. 5N708]|uniref:MBL fold metallo-hydrolase n=1 Tax=Saccharopolyspora sp. 5N708 TaxID=3457424 RepID=UPI003FD0A9D0